MYVVTSRSLNQYLNSLGFVHRTDKDRNNPDREVYLFPKSIRLMEAITFYSELRQDFR